MPVMGLEPATLRLRVNCSADSANQMTLNVFLKKSFKNPRNIILDSEMLETAPESWTEMILPTGARPGGEAYEKRVKKLR